jgi:EAL domain-containing protein (putative c-di-GMP-specific phosphodiesterase class I)
MAPLVRGVDSNPNSRIMVENIVGFTRRMQILTIAEFVHSASVQDTTREFGLDYSQGYLIGKPQERVASRLVELRSAWDMAPAQVGRLARRP